jgi:DNA-binding NtrC family response regulator
VIEPLGSSTPIPVDVRVVSATNADLRERIAAGLFREDLYYRLKVLDLFLPPLRERHGDLPLLLQHFLRELVPQGRELPTVSPRAWAALLRHRFPGNVREFAHAIERAVVLARGGEIRLEHLPVEIAGESPLAVVPDAAFAPLAEALRGFEAEHLLRALRLSGGKRVRAAELLGISRKNLWEKLRAHGLSDLDLDEGAEPDATDREPTGEFLAHRRGRA